MRLWWPWQQVVNVKTFCSWTPKKFSFSSIQVTWDEASEKGHSDRERKSPTPLNCHSQSRRNQSEHLRCQIDLARTNRKPPTLFGRKSKSKYCWPHRRRRRRGGAFKSKTRERCLSPTIVLPLGLTFAALLVPSLSRGHSAVSKQMQYLSGKHLLRR